MITRLTTPFTRAAGTALLVLGLSTTAFARPGHGPGDGGFRFPGRALKKLNLTPEQEKKIKEIRKGDKEEMQKARQSLKEQHKELRQKMASDKATDDELRKSFSNLETQQADFKKKVFDRMLKIRAVLTPEQRKELASMAEKRFEKSKHRRGPPPGHDDDDGDDE